MKIHKLVNKLIWIHGTNNPFKIAKENKIIVIIKDLGTIKGFYKKILRRKFIFINEKLNDFERKLVCGHELGHALLHNYKDLQFMLDNTKIIRKSLLEEEANEFASLLLKDNNDYTLSKVENIEFEVCEKIINKS